MCILHRYWCALALSLFFLMPVVAAPVAVPDFLKPYAQWLELQNPDWQCHFQQDASRQCLWTGFLRFNVNKKSGTFTVLVDAQSKSNLPLPGHQQYWPKKVQIQREGQSQVNPATVFLNKKGMPAIALPAGRYRVFGEFQWLKPPKSIQIPTSYAVVDVQTPKGLFWHRTSSALNFSKTDQAATPAQQQDDLRVRVYRRLIDGIPQKLETRIQLVVSGQPRMIHLPRLFPPGVIPIDFQSSLPIRLERDGTIALQAKPGTFWLKYQGRYSEQTLDIQWFNQQNESKEKNELPKTQKLKKSSQQWPEHEYWAYRMQPTFGLKVSQGTLVDTQQIDAPAQWRALPTYRLSQSEPIKLELPQYQKNATQRNALHLKRDIWLRFSGDEFIINDVLTGDMRQGWRFNLKDGALLRVMQHNQPLLISLDPDTQAEGVEVRQQKVDITAISAIKRDHQLSTIGWDLDVDAVSAVLHLPPGWSLMAALGDRGESDSWLNRWTVWALFLVLAATILGYKILGIAGGGASLAMGVFIYQTDASWIIMWFMVLICTALYQIDGRWKNKRALVVLIVAFVIVIKFISFTVLQTRLMIYPQLERHQMHYPSQPILGSSDAVRSFAQESKRAYAKSNTIKAAPQQKRVMQGDTDLLQTGEGVPRWRWNQYQLVERGISQSSDALHIIVFNPVLYGLWRFAGLLSIALALVLLGRRLLQEHDHSRQQAALRGSRASGSIVPGICMMLCVLPFLGLMPTAVQAKINSETIPLMSPQPPSAVFDQLEQYLQASPECLPSCVAIQSAVFTMDEHTLEFQADIHASAAVAVPLPSTLQWQPTIITLNDQDARAKLVRAQHKQNFITYIQVPPGISTLTMKGQVSDNQVTLSMPLPLLNVQYKLDHWRIPGVNLDQNGHAQSKGAVKGKLRFEKNQDQFNSASQKTKRSSSALQAPVYLEVQRSLHLGVRWVLTTQVRRIAPKTGFIQSKIALWPGERPITAVDTDDGFVMLDLKNSTSQSWTSEIEPTEHLLLRSDSGQDYFESWVVTVGPSWHLSYQGITPQTQQSPQQSPQQLTYTWRPTPAQSLQLSIQKPEAKPGQSQSIDQAHLEYRLGDRFNRGRLKLEMLSASPGEYELMLGDVTIDQATLNGQPLYDIKNGQVRAQIEPGQHHLLIEWQEPASHLLRYGPSDIQSSLPLSNLHVTILPLKGQWIFRLFGSAMGPAILYWSVLFVLILSAILISKVQRQLSQRISGFDMPMKQLDWLLLGIGTSTLWFYALVPVTLWLFALAWRRSIDPVHVFQQSNRRFQALQISLLAIGIVVIVLVVTLVPQSLLATPDMFISGNGSSSRRLSWFQDSVASGHITGFAFLALPGWVFNSVMLAWSLWLAHKTIQWLQFAIQAMQHKKIWRLTPKVEGSVP